MPCSVPRWRVAQAINQLGFIAADFAGGGIENGQAGYPLASITIILVPLQKQGIRPVADLIGD